MKPLFALLTLALLASSAAAQPVSDDEVNAVAAKLYCPVCEHVPLDDCDTPACRQWHAEIRHQLAAGQSPQAIIDDFVQRFGERVVGTPQDPLLRALALLTPWALALGALLPAAAFIRRRRRIQASDSRIQADQSASSDAWRAQIEADLRARR